VVAAAHCTARSDAQPQCACSNHRQSACGACVRGPDRRAYVRAASVPSLISSVLKSLIDWYGELGDAQGRGRRHTS
jgi:hypothetical protein